MTSNAEIEDALRFLDWRGTADDARAFASERRAARVHEPSESVEETLYGRAIRAQIDQTLALPPLLNKPMLAGMLFEIVHRARRLYKFYLSDSERAEVLALKPRYDEAHPGPRKTMADLPEDARNGVVTVPRSVIADAIFEWVMVVPGADT